MSYHSASRTRTYDIMINSHALLPTELWRIKLLSSKNSPYGIRTRVTAVKRRCLNPLTNGPELVFSTLTIIPTFCFLSTTFLNFLQIFQFFSSTVFQIIVKRARIVLTLLLFIKLRSTFFSPPIGD